MSELVAVQNALMAKLRNGLPDLVRRVFDTVPEGKGHPYATVSTPSNVPVDEDCWDRTDIVFQIDFWSSHRNSTEVKRIAGNAKDLLHEQPLSAPGYVVDRMTVAGIFYSREQGTLLHRARLMLAIAAQPI